MHHPPQCLTGLLTAALGRRQFTEELKLQDSAVPHVPGPSPAPHVQSLTEPHHRGDWGFQSLFWVVRRVTLGPHVAFSLGNPQAEPGLQKASGVLSL